MSKILIADETTAERASVAAALSTGRHDIREAGDAVTCARLVSEFQPTLVICDFDWMGTEPGVTVRKWRCSSPLLAVIALVDYTNATAARRAFKVGVYDVLMRPASDPEEIGLVVARTLAWVQLLRERIQLTGLLSKRSEEIQRATATVHDPNALDALTGLANHRVAQETLLDSVIEAQRSKRPVSFLYIDIDNFRLFNDAQGYRRGDMLLQAVGSRLREFTRPTDLVARWGGDEFALVMPGADATLAVAVARRILAAVPAMAPVGRESQSGVSITASLAVATLGEHAGNAAGLVAQTEQAMIQAKRKGRNNVQLAAGYAPDAGNSSIFSGLHRALGD